MVLEAPRMLLKWFNAREAAKVGTALADQFPRPPMSGAAAPGKQEQLRGAHGEALRDYLRRAIHEMRGLRLNFYKRAWFANSFKWRLVENGVDAETANEWTQTLVLEASAFKSNSVPSHESPAPKTNWPGSGRARSLAARGDESYIRGDYAEAATYYQDSVALKPRQAAALNGLGAALCKLGRYKEAEDYFRKAIGAQPDHPEAHANLGAVYLARGQFFEAENSLRRALKSKPADLDRRCNLGLTLVNLGRLQDARAQLEKVLNVAPRHVEALVGMGLVARTEGRFDEAGAMFNRALEVNPKMPGAWAALAGIRKMTSDDGAWLKRAQEIAAGGITPLEEATVRFAIGKYCDDVREFERAFKSYKRANELLKTLADKYQADVATRFGDDLIRVYTRETLGGVASGASASMKPVFVVGMMRSGTSLVEQIIASHPAAAGAGELEFWNDVMRKHGALIRRGPLGEGLRKELAERYLRALACHSVDALRVVDKAPVNSDFLGVIHSVFPNARIIYMQRDPIDTCLSCYFQQFSATLNFTMDLSDLAHHYREHQRLMAHWRAVLPQGAILDVPYAELIADQEGWTRKILDFIGLEWDQRCLDFHRTERPVVTASYWQVRQGIYSGSVQRWRNYRKFIGPLLDLKA
jgi:tetratricopeptide (TPR) repeat protein